MACRHDGLRDIRSTYDSAAGVLIYHWICEQCSAILDEAGRAPYSPTFKPGGNDPGVAPPRR
jgi:hypothetical protein